MAPEIRVIPDILAGEEKTLPPRSTVRFYFSRHAYIDVSLRERNGKLGIDVSGNDVIEIEPVAANLVRVRVNRDR